MIRVLVVDNAKIIREKICAILAEHPEFTAVAQASTATEAIELAKEHQPDVVLLDVSMPHLNGLQASPIIKKVAPQAEIMIVTQYDNPIFVREAFAVGARGFLIKRDVGAELHTAVSEVFLKRKFVSRSLQNVLLDPAS